MTYYEVILHTRKGYRYIIEADNPDVAHDRAAGRYDNDEDGEEGGYENVISVTCNLIEKPENDK